MRVSNRITTALKPPSQSPSIAFIIFGITVRYGRIPSDEDALYWAADPGGVCARLVL